MLNQNDINMIFQEKEQARIEERNRIKSLIRNKGFLVNDDKHGHGFLIPDDLWIKLFG